MSDRHAFDAHNADYVERLLEAYLVDTSSVPPAWRDYFRQLSAEEPGAALVSPRPARRPASIFNPRPETNGARAGFAHRAELFQERVERLVRAYRLRGHLIAELDPLGSRTIDASEFDLARFGLSEADLAREVSTETVGGPEQQTLGQLIERLRSTYCRYIGVQYAHVDDLEICDWLAEQMERSENRYEIPRRVQWRILTRLTEAVAFEEFVRRKYVAAKSFSLEGCETLVPLLDLALEDAAAQGVREVVIGMAHRGRLNVLAHIIGKDLKEIFAEFEDTSPERYRGRGDVKYHQGFSGDWQTASNQTIHLSLCFNPSHLEFVNPVAIGRVRAKQDRTRDLAREQVMPLLIHGDAAFAGEGVTQETLNLSQLPGYTVGGTLHVVVNNQIGFTTSPGEGRSTAYASDVARMLDIPIFHVNGEDPESVAQVVRLAMNFRRRFRRDVVIDLYGYRRWGHNEADEPSFTQPLLYRAIEHRASVRDAYLDRLLALGGITRDEADAMAQAEHERMRAAFEHVHEQKYQPPPPYPPSIWSGYHGGEEPVADDPETAVSREALQQLMGRLIDLPADFHTHRKLHRLLEVRRRMADGEEPLDWSAAEALAIATLAIDGARVRLVGQDSERGTFSQRHAVLHDVVDGRRNELFQHLVDDQAQVEIVNSPLSEIAALGFEYGYSLDYPHALVAWEAQFGDFVNVAQVITDQFLASAEDKWNRLSGLVLLLPHGFEGQGPEHSSARIERFLTLAAEDNIQVVWPTTPAQFFHVLRRQVLRSWIKPLVVFTPKSMLRDTRARSSLDELARERFRRVIADERPSARRTSRVLLTSGKVYYDLFDAREQTGRDDLAIVRVEQLYPLADGDLVAALGRLDAETPVTWVQEEPANMGAWPYWRARYGDRLLGRYPLGVVSRAASASPATGSSAAHGVEHEELIVQAIG